MTPVYEVDTRHTKEVLYAFIKFQTEINSRYATFKLAVFGAGFLTLAWIGRERLIFTIVCAVLGLFFLFLAFGRKFISFRNLSKSDPLYQKQQDIHMTFGHSGFSVENGEETKNYKYGELKGMYADAEYFYLHTDDDDLLVIPKTDFTNGTADDFYPFLMDKTKKDIKPVKIPFKQQYQQNLEQAKIDQAQRKAQMDEQKKNKKKK